MYLYINQSISLSIHIPIHLSVYLSKTIYLSDDAPWLRSGRVMMMMMMMMSQTQLCQVLSAGNNHDDVMQLIAQPNLFLFGFLIIFLQSAADDDDEDNDDEDGDGGYGDGGDGDGGGEEH